MANAYTNIHIPIQPSTAIEHKAQTALFGESGFIDYIEKEGKEKHKNTTLYRTTALNTRIPNFLVYETHNAHKGRLEGK